MRIAAIILTALLTIVHSQDITWYNTSDATFEISTEQQLKGLAQLVNNNIDLFAGKTIKLTGDITLIGNFTPIGNDTRNFQGVFDGQGHTISGLSVSGFQYAGLFGYVGINGQIKNINVIGSKIKGTSYVGGLVAYYASAKSIENCNVQADSIVASSNYGGGLVGYVSAMLTITNSYTRGNVTVSGSVSTSSYMYGSSGYGGGLVGYASSTLAITNSYTSGNVNVIGDNGGKGSNADLSGRDGDYGGGAGSGYGGGLVGYASSTLSITNSYISGNVNVSGGKGGDGGNGSNGALYDGGNGGNGGMGGYSYVGGLVGYAYNTSTITNSYVNGNVIGNGGNGGSGGMGGNRGSNGGSNGSRGSGGTSGSSYSGGLVGYAHTTIAITNGYTSRNVSANGSYPYSGGIFGTYSSGTITSVYYKSEGVSKAAGLGSPTGILGLTSSNLKKQSTFINWNFENIWDIAEGVSYPYLKSFPPPEIWLSLNDINAEYIYDQTYTGSQIKPEPKIKLKEDGTLLKKDEDYTLQYEENKNIGTGTIVLTGIGVYSDLYEEMTFKIMPKTITIPNAAVQNKTYDGTTAATITGTLEGVMESDDVNFSGTGIFANKNAANGIAVTSNITLTGMQANNYKLTQPTGLTANITPKPLAITLNPKSITASKSEPIPNLTDYIVYDGLIAGDAINGTTNFNHSYNPATSPAGSYPITLSGLRTNNNYEISYDNTDLYLIAAANLSDCIIADIAGQTYSALQIKPSISVTCYGTTLTPNDDYTIDYGQNLNVSEGGSITITGVGSLYAGTAIKTFAINKKALTVSGATVSAKTYDGTTTATITGGTLNGVYEEDIDEVSLANLTGIFASADVGTDISVSSSITLTGTAANNDSLTQPTLFGNITEKALPEDAIQTIALQTYTGSNITPSVTVMDGLKILAENTDYSLFFTANRDAGTATVQAIGKGNYEGTVNANFTIQPKPLSNSMVAQIPSQPYTNLPVTPDVIVRDGTKYLVENTDYAVSYSNNTGTGTATVTITGKGNYSGTATAHFLISEPKRMEDLEILPIPAQTYTGNAITPIVTIKDGENTLTEGIDYTIDKYTSNVSVGTGLVQISGIGIYSGTTNVAFTIIAGETPIIANSANHSILVQTKNNEIILQNIPANAKVGVYNLQGKQVYMGNPVNPKILKIMVQTKGIYIVKIDNVNAMRVMVR
ncbi:MAG: YDG domain-containing protein [Fibromonadaceae bacterium]|jgi:hypothetical protein|nr:YDG domain-containing protein [Fibromonadaceae bacterium]